MKQTKRVSSLIAACALVALPALTGAEGGGCGNVVVGQEGCFSTANPDSICMPKCVPEGSAITEECGISPDAYCYNNFGSCQPAEDGCGWEQSPELLECLANTGNECQMADDCVVDASCLVCADGTCAQPACVNGHCEVACDPGPVGCSLDAECQNQPWPAICQLCADGSCALPQCNAGTCELACESGPPQCQAPSDCIFPDVCEPCPDGTCAQGSCTNGTCALTCAPTSECQAAGDCIAIDVCIPCDDGTCASPICNGGTCELACSGPTPAQCGSAEECVFDQSCLECADGTCASGDCVDGACVKVCPAGN